MKSRGDNRRGLAALLCLALTACTAPLRLPEPPGASRVLDRDEVRGTMRYEVFGEVYETLPSSLGYIEIGVASWYGRKFHGRPTSNGEVYDMYKSTAAHKTLPLPTWVRVTNLDNGKKVVLRVNDRGPFHDDRLIDLSWQAASALGFADKGTAPVVVEALDVMNYPELAVAEAHPIPSYYLQIGAFSERRYATLARERAIDLLREHLDANAIKILETEAETGILHKVWVGPIADQDHEALIQRVLVSAGNAKPVRVTVD